MTTSRFLPLLNLAGCLVITGIILAQWLKERGLEEKIDSLHQQLTVTRDQFEAETTRASALENDVAQLKESLESTVRAKHEIEAAMAKLITERETQTAGLATATQQQAKLWENALAERDEKIRTLNSGLTATRDRLEEAISKLKAAGAR